MSLDAKVRKRAEQLLLAADERGVRGPRLLDDAQRLWRHVRHWIDDRHLVGTDCDKEALELACHAVQLPMKQRSMPCVGRYAQVNLRERAEQSAEELVSELGDFVDDPLMERTVEILHELPVRAPAKDEAKLLADVVNLEDFGVTGMINQTVLLASMGQGLSQLIEATEKREAYGYWEARIKDGFHFGPTRELARRRLSRARQLAKLLHDELKEHGD